MTETQPESPFPRQARARLGTTLNAKYRLDRLIGVGGMASVYAATHRNGNRVAVKMLHGPLSVDPDIRRRFLREGYVANKVGHRGAVRVIDDDEAEDGTAFLVMELLSGESLDVHWDRARRCLPATEVLALTHELLDTLSAAHASGIVHRDIKPANLFLTTEGELKVLDFGIARLLEAAQGGAHTHTGRAVGTPAFMPPEQALGRTRDIDGQTDLWAVGATMFTLLSGQDVHEAENASEQLVFAATKPARSLATVAAHLPAALVEVVDRAVSFDKKARWADARAMQEAVARAHVEITGQPVESSIDALGASDFGGGDTGEERTSIATGGAVKSSSPRAFAPTERSTPPPPPGGRTTAPSTELARSAGMSSRRAAEAAVDAGVAPRGGTLPSAGALPAHPTTGGGAFSLERPASSAGGATGVRARTRRNALAAMLALAAAIGAVSVVELRGRPLGAVASAGQGAQQPLAPPPPQPPPRPAPEPAAPTAVATTPPPEDTARPLAQSKPAPRPRPPVAASAATPPSASARLATVPAPSAQGGVVVTPPY